MYLNVVVRSTRGEVLGFEVPVDCPDVHVERADLRWETVKVLRDIPWVWARNTRVGQLSKPRHLAVSCLLVSKPEDRVLPDGSVFTMNPDRNSVPILVP